MFNSRSIEIEGELAKAKADLREAQLNAIDYLTVLLDEHKVQNQKRIDKISSEILGQQEDIEQEIKLLKSSQEDFPGLLKMLSKELSAFLQEGL